MKLSRRKKVVNHKRRIMFFALFFLLLFISMGYSYLNTTLSINGHTELAANSWDIHFANLSIINGSATASIPAAISGNTTTVNYSIELDNPGDFYEFEVDVVNSGTLAGKVSSVGIQGISSTVEPYLDTSILYTNNVSVQVNDILNPNSSKRIRVRVAYKEDVGTLPDNVLVLVFSINYILTNKEEITTDTIIQQLKTENASCFTKYEGQVTDQVGQTVTASNVYFNKCADKRNIKFAGYCWQMIRTTETGGIKMVYNGDVDANGKCTTTSGTHKGIVGENGSSQTLNAEYLYGSSFTYDITNSSFTLTDTSLATWSDSTYENLLGKFTCKNTTGTCTTLYNVNGHYNNTTAYTSSYTIGDTKYAQIGISAFNANHRSLAMVGYMFNKVYNYVANSAPTSGSLMGNDVSYSNGTYTLLPADGESTLRTTKDDTHHYTCNNTTGTCNKVRYYNYSSGSDNYYIELDGEQNIEEAVNNMLYNNNVNRYNSSIKGIIDAWYAQNLSSKTNMLEDTVYCNARNMTNQATNGWNKDGSLSTNMNFKNHNDTTDLSCQNETDQFAVSSNKAKLTYPVSLISSEEWNNIGTESLRQTGAYYWVLSPNYFNRCDPNVRYVNAVGSWNGNCVVHGAEGLRPAVSLSTGAVISEGTGSESDPWIIE